MADGAAKIACIGWGSLVWDSRDLPVLGDWQMDGPMLPIEFARESQDGRMTLVLCDGVPLVPACWTILDVEDVGFAIEGLAAREGIKTRIAHDIGWWNSVDDKARGMCADVIRAWAKEQGLAGVVWTNLPCGFKASRGVMPARDQALAHIVGLEDEPRRVAIEYVHKAPAQVSTPYRQAIEAVFPKCC